MIFDMETQILALFKKLGKATEEAYGQGGRIFQMSWLEKMSLSTLMTLQQNNLVPFCFFSAAPRTCHHKHMLSSRKVTKKVYKKCGLCSSGLPSLVQLDHIKGYYFLWVNFATAVVEGYHNV